MLEDGRKTEFQSSNFSSSILNHISHYSIVFAYWIQAASIQAVASNDLCGRLTYAIIVFVVWFSNNFDRIE